MNTGSEDSEDEENCKITDSEEKKPVQANTSALEILIASSQKHGSFDSTFAYQRGPEPSERTLFRRSQQERERRGQQKILPHCIPSFQQFLADLPQRLLPPPSPPTSVSSESPL